MTLAMSAAVIATEVLFLNVLHAGDLLTLVVSLPVAMLTYLGGTFLVDRRIFSEARGVLLRGF
jgi:hypothetical protein